ncbi:serine hydrolase domain-containing protein [Thioclava sp. FR2]|uniref:serine hydrolase domain-containing protein n=1 Tax=Thioclava sp. FR2 TaxID=3445780 RepID=UPI003EC0E0E3
MKRSLVRGLLALVVVLALLGLWKREDITRLMAVNTLFAPEKIVTNFSHMDRLFWTTEMARGEGPVSPLPKGEEIVLSKAEMDWIADRQVTGLVILKDGLLRHESYYLGTAPEDRRISWSMAKSWLASLLGIVMAEGKIASLDDPVTTYAPDLTGSAYDGATIRNVLNMASGVEFNEDYLDFWSDINKMGRVLALGQSMNGFAASIGKRSAAPGAEWKYVSIDTHVIGMVIEGATGEKIADLMQRHLVQPMGLEVAPKYITDGYGTAFVLGGLNMPTRDYARFGAMIAAGGQWQGRQVVPAAWVAQMIAPSAPGDVGYGYQWWVPEGSAPGEVLARGVYGQYIFIDSDSGIVIAVNSADRRFKEPGRFEEDMVVLRGLAGRL